MTDYADIEARLREQGFSPCPTCGFMVPGGVHKCMPRHRILGPGPFGGEEAAAALRDLRAENGKLYDAGYRAGLRNGLRRYAWWADGTQYVGTCGKTLAEALAEDQMRRMDWEAGE